MAKSSRNKQRPAPSRPPAQRGRPAGLFTWIAIGLVVVVVAVLVIIKVSGGGPAKSGNTTFQAADPAVVAELTGIPASVFNTIGVTSPIATVSPPITLKKQALLTTSVNGQSLPVVLYIGGEFCPYCAAERWSTIIALSRFGTFRGLGNMASYSGDQYPNTPTFTFVKAKYTSKYLVFQSVEEYANYLNAAKTYYAKLQKPTKLQQQLLTKYDTPKYVPGMTTENEGAIPFITFANQFLVSGASYPPPVLTGSTRNEIAGALSNATSPITDAIVATANYQTAAICSITHDQPSTVCSSKGVMAAKKAMKIK